MENFMESAQSRETSQELIEAIYYVSGNDDEEAVRVWEYPTEREDFERVCINALNSVSRDELTDEEWELHEQWVVDNWEDLNA